MSKEMKKSTKVLSYVFGTLLALCMITGIGYGVATMGSDSSPSQSYSQPKSESPF